MGEEGGIGDYILSGEFRKCMDRLRIIECEKEGGKVLN